MVVLLMMLVLMLMLEVMVMVLLLLLLALSLIHLLLTDHLLLLLLLGSSSHGRLLMHAGIHAPDLGGRGADADTTVETVGIDKLASPGEVVGGGHTVRFDIHLRRGRIGRWGLRKVHAVPVHIPTAVDDKGIVDADGIEGHGMGETARGETGLLGMLIVLVAGTVEEKRRGLQAGGGSGIIGDAAIGGGGAGLAGQFGIMCRTGGGWIGGGVGELVEVEEGIDIGVVVDGHGRTQ